MRTLCIAVTTSLLLALSLTGCGSSPSPIKDEAAMVKDLREYIPSVAAYDDEYLVSVAEKVCSLGRDDGARILDNYGELEASDYDAFVTVVFGVKGCPQNEGD